MAKRPTPPSKLDPLAYEILANLLADFTAKGLGAGDLENGYEGPSLASLIKHCQVGDVATQVDFDLAFKQLEESSFVRTGPWAPYDNEPGSGIFIIGGFSKREFASLTENGYRAARKPKPGFERF